MCLQTDIILICTLAYVVGIFQIFYFLSKFFNAVFSLFVKRKSTEKYYSLFRWILNLYIHITLIPKYTRSVQKVSDFIFPPKLMLRVKNYLDVMWHHSSCARVKHFRVNGYWFLHITPRVQKRSSISSDFPFLGKEQHTSCVKSTLFSRFLYEFCILLTLETTRFPCEVASAAETAPCGRICICEFRMHKPYTFEITCTDSVTIVPNFLDRLPLRCDHV